VSAGVERDVFGHLPDGRPIARFTLRNRHALCVQVIEYGATITSVMAPGRTGTFADITLGFDTLAGYLAPHPHIGCTVGRVAGRIGNARFALDGVTHRLPANQPPHHLHGGEAGLHRVPWTGTMITGSDGPPAVQLRHCSPDGDEGYPGRLEVTLRLSLSDDDVLTLDYRAATDRATPVSLTNHAYWNLAGIGSIHDHLLRVSAVQAVVLDASQVATGALMPVDGTPLDLRHPRRVGDVMAALPGGLDHLLVLDAHGAADPPLVALHDPVSGRTLTMTTDQPVLVVYGGNHLHGGLPGKAGVPFALHAGLCLEPQGFPDAVNRPEFPTTIVRPGTPYHQRTTLAFGIDRA
jgi:aldose 1-epimerase